MLSRHVGLSRMLRNEFGRVKHNSMPSFFSGCCAVICVSKYTLEYGTRFHGASVPREEFGHATKKKRMILDYQIVKYVLCVSVLPCCFIVNYLEELLRFCLTKSMRDVYHEALICCGAIRRYWDDRLNIICDIDPISHA